MFTMRGNTAAFAGAIAVASLLHAQARQTGISVAKGLTDVSGIKVGHFTLSDRPTGCTVILAEAGAVAGVDVRGAAPATRETDVLNPVNLVQIAHAIVLSGGSAFGLDAASRAQDRLSVRAGVRADRAGRGAVRFGRGGRPDSAERRLRLSGGPSGIGCFGG